MTEIEIKDLNIRRNMDKTFEISLTAGISENTADTLLNTFKKAKQPFMCSFKERRHKRSLDANNFAWLLMGKLAESLKTTDKEVYREIIKRVGAYQIVPIQQEAADEWIRIWESNGIGWQTEDLGECKNTKGYHNIKCYFGSSTYDSKNMSKLLEEIIYECNQQGIDTMTPQEKERLLREWGNG